MLGCSAARPMTPALLGLVLAAAPAVGYVQATGWFERASNPAHYQPLHLVDGDLKTGWCSSGGDALAETLTLGVGAPVGVDEVRIATGNQADTNAFHTYARPRKFVLRTEGRASTFTVADTEGLQSVKLDVPLQGTFFSLEVLDGAGRRSGDARLRLRGPAGLPPGSRWPTRRRSSSAGTPGARRSSAPGTPGTRVRQTGASASSSTAPGCPGRWSTESPRIPRR
jgi:hypothetical protein